MPIINLTQEAMDRGKSPEPGWSPAVLHDVSEFASANKESMNYGHEFMLTGGPGDKGTENKGRYVTILFNTKALGMNGAKGVPEVVKRFQTMIAALQGIKYNEVRPDGYDTELMKGKTCWIKVEPTLDNLGKLRHEIVDFASDNDVPF